MNVHQGINPYSSALTDKSALQGAKFGSPQKGVWNSISSNPDTQDGFAQLSNILESLASAGASTIPVEFPSADEIIPAQGGWDWKFPRNDASKSEFTVVATDFYNDIGTYLGSLTVKPSGIHGLEGIIAYNINHTVTEGGVPGTIAAWPTGQDNFDAALEFRGKRDDTYWNARRYIERKSREEGIDAAMQGPGRDGALLDALLVPINGDGAAAVQFAAKAGE